MISPLSFSTFEIHYVQGNDQRIVWGLDPPPPPPSPPKKKKKKQTI